MGKVFNIQRFSTGDGPGMRTTVFLKGWPLLCQWCHNPESRKSNFEIFYISEKCIGCKACDVACKNDAHLFSDGSHIFMREKCVGCGCCTSKCNADALLPYVEKIKDKTDKMLEIV